MDVTLRNMTQEEYPIWIDVSTKQQALDRCSISQKHFDEEYKNLLDMLRKFLPDHQKTKGHIFLSIDTLEDKNIGYVWCAELPDLPNQSIFIMDIHILKDFRSRGIGRIALQKVHNLLKDAGFRMVFLSVLNQNYAKKLYASLGYVVIRENEFTSTMSISLLD
ncbi:MAG: GNAT family N-acetyltransferase [Candidatus Izemoplasmatales bacterium]|nr:GNAT family N-acetyltransferase [Candidatus Izemoplasmatales bacterium]